MSRFALLTAVLPLFLCAPAAAEFNAYVVNEGSASVSIIGTKNDEVSGTIKVGDRPRGLAVSTDAERLYVIHDDGTLLERELYAKADSGGAKLGRLPRSINLSPDGRLLAAAMQDDAEMVLLDLATMRVVRKIPIVGGKGPVNAVFSPDGRSIYVTAEESPEIHVIDVKQGAVTKSIRVGPRLGGIAFLPDGSRAYVAAGRGEVVAIDVARHAVLARVKTASAPFALTAHRDGKRVFVSASRAAEVQVLDTRSNRIVANFEVGRGCSSMALTPDGRKLYVACGSANQVSVIDTSTYRRLAQVAVGVGPVSIVISDPNPPLDGGESPPRRGKTGAS